MKRETDFFDFYNQLILKYDSKCVNSFGNLANGLMIVNSVFERIPNHISIEDEEEMFYNYIFGKMTPKCKTEPNAIQHKFILNSCDDIIDDNFESSFFKKQDLSDSSKRFAIILSLSFMSANLGADKIIKGNLTFDNLREDLFLLYFKKYSIYRRDPNNQIFNNRFKKITKQRNKMTNNDHKNLNSNFTIDEKAAIITDLIIAVTAPVSAGGSMMEHFGLKGLQIAKKLLDDCMPHLDYIKDKVGSANYLFLNLSDSIAVTTSAIIKMPVSAIGIEARAIDFQKNSARSRQLILDIEEAARLMIIISNIPMTIRAKQTINQNLDILRASRNAVENKNFWTKLFS